jgi:hypothetical protein
MKGKLTPAEARSIQILERNPDWQKFKQYILRRYSQASDECETIKDDHRYCQGRALELKMMANIESKAYSIINGT